MPGASASSTSVSTVAAVNVVGAPRPSSTLSCSVIDSPSRLFISNFLGVVPVSSFASSVTDFSAVVDDEVVTSFTVSAVFSVSVVSVGVTVSVPSKASSICLF